MVSSLPEYKWPEGLLAQRRHRVFAAMIFHLCRLAGMILSLLSRRRKAVLVIRTDGIGDAILFEPALRSLAARFADHELHMWAPAATCELLRGHPYIARLRPILRGAKAGNLTYFGSFGWRAKLGWAIGRQSFEVAIYPAESPEPLGNWLLGSVRAGERWYNPGDLQNQFDWQQASAMTRATRLLKPLGRGHELSRNAYLATQWEQDIHGDSVRLYPTYDANCAVEWDIAAWHGAAERLGARALAGVVPSSAMAVKSYPVSKWREVIARLWEEHRVLCALIGGPADKRILAELSAALGDVPHVKMTRPVDMLAVASLIGRLDAVISLDTAAAHLGCALDIPTIVLCGGGHPGRFFPWPDAQQLIVLNHPMPCEGCLCRCSQAEARCISEITAEQVIAAYVKLREAPEEAPAIPLPSPQPMRVAS